MAREERVAQQSANENRNSGTAAGSAGDKPAPTPQRTPASENLGQEGTQSTVKRNTTNEGERQDRGP